MKTYPSIPPVADAPDRLLAEGHLWLFEQIAGAHLRFRLTDAGYVEFGDRTRVFADEDQIPAPYNTAVRYVRDSLDRSRLREALDAPGDAVFYGEATIDAGVAYDWAEMPPFLGFDVWSRPEESFRPLDAVEGIFDGIGLQAVNTVAREVRARDFDPGTYQFPRSAWYDGPAAGVVLRNKRGDRAVLSSPDVVPGEPDDTAAPSEESAEELAREIATAERFERVAGALERRGQPATVERVHERVLDVVFREETSRLFDRVQTHDAEQFRPRVDLSAFRGAVAERTRAFLAER